MEVVKGFKPAQPAPQSAPPGDINFGPIRPDPSPFSPPAQTEIMEKQMPLVRLEELKKRDESHMMEHRCQENLEEYSKRFAMEYTDACFAELKGETKRFAMEYIDACFAKLQGETKRCAMEYADACFAKLQEETNRSAMEYSDACFAKTIHPVCFSKGGEGVKGFKPAQPTPPRGNLSAEPDGITDESRKKYMFFNPQLAEAYLEDYKRDAMEYMDSCFAKLQETIRPGVEYELISVHLIIDGIFSHKTKGHYTHIHFKAKRQNADPHQHSPEVFCAVILKDDGNRVLGCSHLANHCDDDDYLGDMADQKNCLWARDYEYPATYR